MKVGKIIPCVCIDHYPESADSCDYGMPDIAVGQGEWFSCYCKLCGRGGRWLDHTSTYKALKEWNRMQRSLWRERCCYTWTDLPRDDISDWERRVFDDFIKEGKQ